MDRIQHRGFNRILLIFDEAQLKYDIGNAAFIHGEAARVHDNYGHDLLDNSKEQAMHSWKDVCAEGNYDRVRANVRMAIGEIEQMLHQYTAKLVLEHNSIDNIDHGATEFAIEMCVPNGFCDTNAQQILHYSHEYIISRVLEDWAGMTFAEAQQYWTARRVDTEERIRNAARFSGYQTRVKPSII